MTASNIDRTHLVRLLAGCALVMQLAACTHIDEEPPPIDEEWGLADYFLDNRTDRSLIIDLTLSPERGGHTRQTDPVAAGEVFPFEADGIIGVNPLPWDTFASLRLVDEAGNVVYRQDPIDNDAWIVERVDDEEYGRSFITLVITNASLAPGGAGAPDSPDSPDSID
jgi:hypothetical protein